MIGVTNSFTLSGGGPDPPSESGLAVVSRLRCSSRVRNVAEVFVPLEWQVDNAARLVGVDQDIQSVAQDSGLRLRISREARLMTERVVHEDRPRRVHARGDVARRCDHDCGDSRLFDDACNQTNGLVVEWSGGYQDEGVYVVLLQLRD